MLIQHFCIIACIFLRGKCIDVAANRIKLLGNILGAKAVGAFKEHMFNEMGNTVVQGIFIAGTGSDPDSKGNGPAGRNFFCNHPQAV
ncbi:hypothetical protein D3C80_1973200 [compost metagenome]